MNAEQIKDLIAAGLPCQHLEVDGDGRHWFAVIVSKAFEGQGRVQRQRMVNATVHAKMASDELHALSMRTLTPSEWQAAQSTQ